MLYALTDAHVMVAYALAHPIISAAVFCVAYCAVVYICAQPAPTTGGATRADDDDGSADNGRASTAPKGETHCACCRCRHADTAGRTTTSRGGDDVGSPTVATAGKPLQVSQAIQVNRAVKTDKSVQVDNQHSVSANTTIPADNGTKADAARASVTACGGHGHAMSPAGAVGLEATSEHASTSLDSDNAARTTYSTADAAVKVGTEHSATASLVMTIGEGSTIERSRSVPAADKAVQVDTEQAETTSEAVERMWAAVATKNACDELTAKRMTDLTSAIGDLLRAHTAKFGQRCNEGGDGASTQHHHGGDKAMMGGAVGMFPAKTEIAHPIDKSFVMTLARQHMLGWTDGDEDIPTVTMVLRAESSKTHANPTATKTASTSTTTTTMAATDSACTAGAHDVSTFAAETPAARKLDTEHTAEVGCYRANAETDIRKRERKARKEASRREYAMQRAGMLAYEYYLQHAPEPVGDTESDVSHGITTLPGDKPIEQSPPTQPMATNPPCDERALQLGSRQRHLARVHVADVAIESAADPSITAAPDDRALEQLPPKPLVATNPHCDERALAIGSRRRQIGVQVPVKAIGTATGPPITTAPGDEAVESPPTQPIAVNLPCRGRALGLGSRRRQVEVQEATRTTEAAGAPVTTALDDDILAEPAQPVVRPADTDPHCNKSPTSTKEVRVRRPRQQQQRLKQMQQRRQQLKQKKQKQRKQQKKWLARDNVVVPSIVTFGPYADEPAVNTRHAAAELEPEQHAGLVEQATMARLTLRRCVSATPPQQQQQQQLQWLPRDHVVVVPSIATFDPYADDEPAVDRHNIAAAELEPKHAGLQEPVIEEPMARLTLRKRAAAQLSSAPQQRNAEPSTVHNPAQRKTEVAVPVQPAKPQQQVPELSQPQPLLKQLKNVHVPPRPVVQQHYAQLSEPHAEPSAAQILAQKPPGVAVRAHLAAASQPQQQQKPEPTRPPSRPEQQTPVDAPQRPMEPPKQHGEPVTQQLLLPPPGRTMDVDIPAALPAGPQPQGASTNVDMATAEPDPDLVLISDVQRLLDEQERLMELECQQHEREERERAARQQQMLYAHFQQMQQLQAAERAQLEAIMMQQQQQQQQQQLTTPNMSMADAYFAEFGHYPDERQQYEQQYQQHYHQLDLQQQHHGLAHAQPQQPNAVIGASGSLQGMFTDHHKQQLSQYQQQQAPFAAAPETQTLDFNNAQGSRDMWQQQQQQQQQYAPLPQSTHSPQHDGKLQEYLQPRQLPPQQQHVDQQQPPPPPQSVQHAPPPVPVEGATSSTKQPQPQPPLQTPHPLPKRAQPAHAFDLATLQQQQQPPPPPRMAQQEPAHPPVQRVKLLLKIGTRASQHTQRTDPVPPSGADALSDAQRDEIEAPRERTRHAMRERWADEQQRRDAYEDRMPSASSSASSAATTTAAGAGSAGGAGEGAAGVGEAYAVDGEDDYDGEYEEYEESEEESEAESDQYASEDDGAYTADEADEGEGKNNSDAYLVYDSDAADSFYDEEKDEGSNDENDGENDHENDDENNDESNDENEGENEGENPDVNDGGDESEVNDDPDINYDIAILKVQIEELRNVERVLKASIEARNLAH